MKTLLVNALVNRVVSALKVDPAQSLDRQLAKAARKATKVEQVVRTSWMPSQGTYATKAGWNRIAARSEQYAKDSKKIPALKGKQPKTGKPAPGGYHIQYNQFTFFRAGKAGKEVLGTVGA